ncbi:MAG: hypothetical protein R3A48_17045 [Polyangiales bacterium]
MVHPKRALRDEAEGILLDCYAAPDLDACREVYRRALALSARAPTYRRAERVLRVCSVTTVYGLLHRRDAGGLLAHLRGMSQALARDPSRRDLARALAWSLAAAAREPRALDDRTRAGTLARAETLLAERARDASVRFPCGEVVAELTLGDPDAMIALCAELRRGVEQSPCDASSLITELAPRWAAS